MYTVEAPILDTPSSAFLFPSTSISCGSLFKIDTTCDLPDEPYCRTSFKYKKNELFLFYSVITFLHVRDNQS
jgi:hypothetical protein